MSIIEAGNDAIALGSVVNVEKFINRLKENKIKPNLPLILILDAVDSGQKAMEKLSHYLRDKFFEKVADISKRVRQLPEEARFKLTDFAKIDTWESFKLQIKNRISFT